METKISMSAIINDFKKRKQKNEENNKILKEINASNELINKIPEAVSSLESLIEVNLFRGSIINNKYKDSDWFPVAIPNNLAVLSVPILALNTGCESCGRNKEYLNAFIYFQKEDEMIKVEEQKDSKPVDTPKPEEIKNV